MQSYSRLKEEHMPGISVCDGWRDCRKTNWKSPRKEISHQRSALAELRDEWWWQIIYIKCCCLPSWQLGHEFVCVFPLIVWKNVHQGVNAHLLKHEIICDQHQSEFLFFLSVAYRPLIIHPCLLAPSRKFDYSFSSMHTHTQACTCTHTYCILTNNRKKIIHKLSNTAVWRVTSTWCAYYMTADVI